MSDIPLTHEQKTFAAEHHSLVYRFLNENHLSESDYYDVIIFGYLNAVRKYLTRKDLQVYAFTTIAWNDMFQSLTNYYRDQNRQKRTAQVVSIHVSLHEEGLPLEERAAAPDALMQQLEHDLVMHDLANRVSKQQMDMVRLRSSGYGVRDIARSQNLSMRRVKELLEEVRVVLQEMCCE